MQFNKILPYLLSLVIFYLVTAAFFQEVAFKGKTLPQHDVIQYEGMSQWPNTHLEKTGERPLWNTGMFSGMPNYAVSFGVENWPVYSLRRLASKIFFTYPIPSLLLTNLICCWILLLSFNVKQKIATIGALVYGFNTFLIVTIEAGHLTKILALGLAALVIAGLRFTFSKKYLVGIPLLCTALAVELMMDHIQITYYLAMVCAVYAISALVVKLQEKDTKSVPVIIAIVLGASLLAVGTVVSKVWLMKEYSAYTIRGERLLTPTEQEKASKPEEGLSREYAFNWSEGKMESLTLLVPSFYGGGSGEKVREGSNVHELFERVAGAQRTRQLMKADQLKVPMYFGDQPFTSGPAYAGAITCFLFILGLLVAENRNRIWMGIGVLLTLFIAWGSNFSAFNYFLFDYFPLFNKFRSPSMALLLTIMLMTLLGFIGLNNVLNSKFTNEIKTKLLAASGITVGLLVIILLYSMMGDFSAPKDLSYGQQFFGDQSKTVSQFAAALAADRASFMRTDAFKGIILILIAVGLIWFYLKNSLAKVWVIAGIGLLTFGDMWIVAKRYLYDAKFEKNAVKSAHKKSKADDLILADQDPHYRVFNLRGAFQEAYTSYFHKSIGGYHAAKLRRYNDLIENRLAIEQQKLVQTLQSGSQDFSSLGALNMLNAKYFKFGDTEREVLRNNYALGNAWFVNSVEDVSNADEEMKKLGEINTATTAVVNVSEFGLSTNSFEKDSLATIQLVKEGPRKMVYQANSSKAGFGIFSEVYYPAGWKATIDGQAAPILRANYVLRALQIPAGKHEIVFTFEPQAYVIGSTISRVSGLIFAVIFFGGFGFLIFKSVTAKGEATAQDEAMDQSSNGSNAGADKSTAASSKKQSNTKSKRKKRRG